jgi:hypothetical protein
MRFPYCYLDEDYQHVWFEHECVSGEDEWSAKGALPGYPNADFPPEALERTWLPVGPDWWQIVSTEPLTVSPSIWCQKCGTHGFFRNGSWLSV